MAKAHTHMQEAKLPSNSYLSVDVFAMGGISILASVCFWLLMDKKASVYQASQLAFAAAFVLNHPHFLSSYVLLYGDFRKRIFSHPRYFWSGVIVPAILLSLLGTALLTGNTQLMAHIITSMFFFVGWHYVKQIFGCVIVTSAQRKLFYTPGERRLMLTNLFAVWFMSWLQSQVEQPGVDPSSGFAFYGINHYRLNLPMWTLQFTYIVLGVTAVGVIGMHMRRYFKKGLAPSAPGLAAYIALYVWYIPAAIHPAFGYFIPAFHSLQYLAFVWTLKRNQVGSEIKDVVAWSERRREWITRFGGFFANSAVLGALMFEFIPKALDKQALLGSGPLGPTPFMAAFLLFINIHHYFIDNTIWRSDNPTVKEHLFHPVSGGPKGGKPSKAAAA